MSNNRLISATKNDTIVGFNLMQRLVISCGTYTPTLTQEDCAHHTRLNCLRVLKIPFQKTYQFFVPKNDTNVDFNLAPRIVKPPSSDKEHTANICNTAVQR